MGKELDDRLEHIATELVCQPEFQPFVRAVLRVSPGEWRPVAECSADLSELPEHAFEVFGEHGNEFVVTHVKWPDAREGESLFVFADRGSGWWTTVLYDGQWSG